MILWDTVFIVQLRHRRRKVPVVTVHLGTSTFFADSLDRFRYSCMRLSIMPMR